MFDRRTFLAAAVAAPLASRLSFAQSDIATVVKPELAGVFADNATEGAFALFERKAARIVVSDEARARKGLLPASTYKVPHALIALETGVVADTDKEVIKWDGVTYPIEEWNHDHTLRSAMKFSVVPVFQQIARRIGSERMQKFIDAFDYGNKDIGGAPIDRFWLSGNLRISAVEQTQFFDKLVRDALPVTKRSLDLVRDIVPVNAEGTIHAKTGTVAVDDKATVGWLAGWGTRDGEPVPFALNIDVRTPANLTARMSMAEALLRAATGT